MDGDLQHAPEDIPALLDKIDEGYDIASGWRKERVDNAIMRKIPSRIANWLMAKASGVELRDFGTTFKAYRAEVLKDVNLYGELHRFIPALASFYGARVAEVPIRNTPRAAGDSHYGIGRTFRVLFDILTIKFLLKYFTRPMHFFGSLGLAGTVVRRRHPGLPAGREAAGHEIVMEHGPLMIAGAPAAAGGPDDVQHRPDRRNDDADLLRKPGPPHLRRARDPHAQTARRRRRHQIGGEFLFQRSDVELAELMPRTRFVVERDGKPGKISLKESWQPERLLHWRRPESPSFARIGRLKPAPPRKIRFDICLSSQQFLQRTAQFRKTPLKPGRFRRGGHHPLAGQQDLRHLAEQHLQREARDREDSGPVQRGGQRPREFGVGHRDGRHAVEAPRTGVSTAN